MTNRIVFAINPAREDEAIPAWHYGVTHCFGLRPRKDEGGVHRFLLFLRYFRLGHRLKTGLFGKNIFFKHIILYLSGITNNQTVNPINAINKTLQPVIWVDSDMV
jgi:hypothetical protein